MKENTCGQSESMWVTMDFYGGMFAQRNYTFHMVIVAPEFSTHVKSSQLQGELLCRGSRVSIHKSI